MINFITQNIWGIAGALFALCIVVFVVQFLVELVRNSAMLKGIIWILIVIAMSYCIGFWIALGIVTIFLLFGWLAYMLS